MEDMEAYYGMAAANDRRDKTLMDELAALKAENERHLADKRKLVSDVLQLQADKAELLKCLEDINMALPITGFEHTRYYVLSLIRKHEAK